MIILVLSSSMSDTLSMRPFFVLERNSLAKDREIVRVHCESNGYAIYSLTRDGSESFERWVFLMRIMYMRFFLGYKALRVQWIRK